MEIKKLLTRNNLLIAVAVIVVLVASIAGYFFLHHSQPKPAPVQVQAPPPSPPPPPPPAPEPVVQQVVEAPPAPPVLPPLAESDSYMLDALSALIDNKSLMKWFLTDRVIRNIVATIDNLPGSEAPMRVSPVRRVPGKFAVAGTEDNWTISPGNAARYRPYVRITEAADAKKVVELYVRLYPLFQQAYEELGYPKKYFNDRLIVVLDNLLDAPDLKGTVKLVQPKVFYLYADSDLEARSIGQRILMRTGSRNEAKIKAWLAAIKQELRLHMHEQKVEGSYMSSSAVSGVAATATTAARQ